MVAVHGAVNSRLRIEVLGPVRALRGGRELALGPPLRQAVLATLALRANHPVYRDELIDAVWGEAAPASAANNLHIYISALRRELASGPGSDDEARILPVGRSGYLLRLAPEQLDVTEFEEHLSRARSRFGDGEPAAGWVGGEWGIEPGRQLGEVHGAILTEGEPPAPVPGASQPWPAVVPRQLPPPIRHFAGRAAELKELDELLDAAAGGAVAVPAIRGSGGVGKTTLAVLRAHRGADRFPDRPPFVNLPGF